MTDTASKNPSRDNSKSNMRSTHPSYREYSFGSLSQNSNTKGNNTYNSSAVGYAPNRSNGAGVSSTLRRNSGNATSRPLSPEEIRKRREEAKRREASARRREAARREAERNRREIERTRRRTLEAAKAAAKKAERLRRKSLVTLHTIVSEKKYAFPMSIVLVALAFTAVILAIVTTSAKINEITAENATLERQYNSLISEESELQLLLETRDDLRVVENLAKNEYGMVKKDLVERYYLSTSKHDTIELVSKDNYNNSDWFANISDLFSSIAERIKAFFIK